MRKITVALNLPERQPGKTILYARHVASSTRGNPHFPSPNVPIATLTAHIDELEAAEIVAMTHADGAATARDAKLVVVENDLRQLKTYVETVANTFADPNEAKAVVLSAGMDVKNSAGKKKGAATAKQGPTSGSVTLYAPHPGSPPTFYWQHSTDRETWTAVKHTRYTELELTGFTPGVRYWFRYQVLVGEVTSDWSDAIELLVV